MFLNLYLTLVFLLVIYDSTSLPTVNSNCHVTNFSQVEKACKSCSDILMDNVVIPAGTTLKLNLTDGAKVTFRGNTTFEFKNWDGPLVTINGTGIVMEGEEGAFFDGQGEKYWDGRGGWGSVKPQFFTIEASHSIFRNLVVYNSPKDVVQATNAVNITFDDWLIDDSAGDELITVDGKNQTKGHNTDGFDVWNSTDVLIQNSRVFNQDDCVAVRCGANVLVQNMLCHGGHGFSISVGFSNDSVPLNTLTNVTFQDSIQIGGANGIHIKTHNDGGPGSLSNVTYRNIKIFDAETYGIQIQQNYPKGEPNNNVPITNLQMIDVTGSVTPHGVPVFIMCADDACKEFDWDHVDVFGQKNDTCNFRPNGYDCLVRS